MSGEYVEAFEFIDVIPEDIRSFIKIESLPLPRTFLPLVSAFEVAVSRLHRKVRFRRSLMVVLATAPFQINVSSGQLSFHPRNDEVINVHIEDVLILLDCNKIMQVPSQPLRIATILEEFAHAIMGINDELLVSQVVALLYEGVRINERGQYEVV